MKKIDRRTKQIELVPHVNDCIIDTESYTEEMKQKILIKYKQDIKLIDFDLTSYV